jgi:uncharacterized protein with HEPN domain
MPWCAISPSSEKRLPGCRKGPCAPDVPWAEMRAMRNLVVHEYFGVSDRILWDTVRANLPSLVAPLKVIQARTDSE